MFYLQHENGAFAAHDSDGEHDGKVCPDNLGAKAFETRGEAAAYSQNFGPDWAIVGEAQKHCRRCGQSMDLDTVPDGCRDPNCPMLAV